MSLIARCRAWRVSMFGAVRPHGVTTLFLRIAQKSFFPFLHPYRWRHNPPCRSQSLVSETRMLRPHCEHHLRLTRDTSYSRENIMGDGAHCVDKVSAWRFPCQTVPSPSGVLAERGRVALDVQFMFCNFCCSVFVHCLGSITLCRCRKSFWIGFERQTKKGNAPL